MYLLPQSPLVPVCLLCASVAGTALAQGVSIEETYVADPGRVGVETGGDADLLMILERAGHPDGAFAPVAIGIAPSNSLVSLTETGAFDGASAFYRTQGQDLHTSASDTDLDGIKDVTEVKAARLLHPLDPSDAAFAEVFDVVPDATIGPGAPGSGAGSIEGPHHVDIYQFDGVGGGGLFFDVTFSDTSLRQVQYCVIDPYGDTLKSTRFSFADLGAVQLPFHGEYLLVVGDAARTNTGQYGFAITIIPPAQQFTIAIGDTIGPDNPAPGAGRLEAPAAFDLYDFEGTAGSKIFVDTLEFSGVNKVNFRLLDPLGEQLFNHQFNLGDVGTVALPVTGTYRLEVGEVGESSTGTYGFSILNVPPPEEFIIAIGDTISDGVPGPGAGRIESPGAFDLYTFTGDAGQNVFFDTGSYSGVNTVNFRLLDPSGAQLFTRPFNTGDQGTMTLPATGTYRLEVGEANNSSTGTYTLALFDVPPPDEFTIAIGDTISDGVPAPGAGRIESPGVFDHYTFAGVAGEKVFFDTLGYDGVNTVNFRLLDPFGAQLFTRPFNTGDQGTMTLPATGTYRLEVGEANNSSTGTYTLALLDVPPPDEFTIAIGDTLSDGVPGPGAGRIESPGAFDQYEFTGVAGEEIDFIVLSYSSVGSVNYTLYDPDGIQLLSRPFNIGDAGDVALPKSGVYRLDVGEVRNDAVGTYALRIRF